MIKYLILFTVITVAITVLMVTEHSIVPIAQPIPTQYHSPAIELQGNILVGNQFRYLTTVEICRRVRGKKILFQGDSTNRRLLFTLRALLRSELTVKLLKYDKVVHRDLIYTECNCTTMEFKWNSKLTKLKRTTWGDYNTVILETCHHKSNLEKVIPQIIEIMNSHHNVYFMIPPYTIVTSESNGRIDTLRSELTGPSVFDMAGLFKNISVGDNRDNGNTPEHVGWGVNSNSIINSKYILII
jgi:hypothetical protein